MQNLDALSANNDTYLYNVPSALVLAGMASVLSSTSSSCSDMVGGRNNNMGSVNMSGIMEGMEQTPPPTTTNPQSAGVIQNNFTSSFTLNFSLLRTLVRVFVSVYMHTFHTPLAHPHRAQCNL